MEPPTSRNVGNVHAAQSAFALPQVPQSDASSALPQDPAPQSDQSIGHPALAALAPQSSTATHSAPAPAQDEATIEQQWIQKAKQIIKQTQNDPFNQSRLLTELKVDYLATRYGRRIEDPNRKP